uniref:Uncharacterized protein n=1 Tax=Musa balbisiana TaxID=52838 RepID=Q1EP36_MUSBA|nr:hypothetical protein MBP_91N22.34 [Musa balbisiana]
MLWVHRCAMLCGTGQVASRGARTIYVEAERAETAAGEQGRQNRDFGEVNSEQESLAGFVWEQRVRHLEQVPTQAVSPLLPEASSVGGSELRMPPKSQKAKKKCLPTRKPHFFKVLLASWFAIVDSDLLLHTEAERHFLKQFVLQTDCPD